MKLLPRSPIWLPSFLLLLLAAAFGYWLDYRHDLTVNLLTRTATDMRQAHRETLAHLAGGALAGAAIMAALMYFAVNRRLQRIYKALGNFGYGNVDVRLGWRGNDAISRLATQFDFMVARMAEERIHLTEGEERLNFALHGSSAGIWDWRIDRSQTYYSPRWKSLLGFSPTEHFPHAEEWLKRVHPEDLPHVMSLLNAHLRGETESFESEHRLRCNDDRYIWVLERGLAIRGADGHAYRMVGALTDISRRKEVEFALQISEEEYRSVVQGVTQIIFRADSAGCLSFLNPAWQELTGFPVETSMGRRLTDFVHPADRAGVALWFDAEMAETGAREFRLLTQQGDVRWFRLHARTLGTRAGACGIAGVLTDIDEQRRTQDALAKSNAERNTILNMSPNGFVFADRAGRVTYVNPAFLAMTGFAHGEVEGQMLETVEDRIRGLCDPDKLMAPAASPTDERADRLYLIEPMPRVLDRLVRNNRDEHGDVQGSIMFCRDVSQEIEADRLKTEFLSTAAHELRTPMASIFGFAELLLVRDFDTATRHEVYQIIHRQTRNLINLVNELLDLARIEAKGAKVFKFREQELSPIVRDAVASQFLPGDNYRLEADLPAALAQVNVDAEKFHQALVNVLGNAVKYSPHGGVIRVSAARRQAGNATLIGISVRDQGIGMSAEQLARVFDRFYRADTSGVIPGTGLGMCLVKEIMDISGGEITIDSVVDRGTEVTLWLPVLPAASVPAETDASSRAS